MKIPASLEVLYQEIAPDLARIESEIAETLHSDRPDIAEMTTRAIGLGGKRLRPAIVLLAGRAAGGVQDAHRRLGTVIELVHVATLVHDDVIDEAALRRRQSTLNRRFSNFEAVLLGDVVFTRAINRLAMLGSEEALLALTASVSELCEGEILQNRHRHNADLDEATYDHIIAAKTATLYATGAALAARFAGATDAAVEGFRRFGHEVGMAFQVVDDCLDLVGEEEVVGKSLGTDLQNGKMTLPMIRLRDRFEEEGDQDGMSLLRRAVGEGATAEDAQRLRELLRERGGLEAATRRARQHVDAGLEAVLPHVADETDRAALQALGDYVLARVL